MIDSQRLLDAALDEIRALMSRVQMAEHDAQDLREAAEAQLERAEKAERAVTLLKAEVDEWRRRYREHVTT